MEWLKFAQYLPILMQLFEKGAAIRQEIRNGGSVIDLLKREAPTLIDTIASIGKSLFPTISDPAGQVQSGATVLDQQLVTTIQTQLNRLGTSPALVVDGAYGAKTKAAVEAFQKANPPLVADGWAGKLTQAALSAAVAKLPS